MESGIGDTAESTQPAPRSRLHLTQPKPRGGEKEATTTQTLPVRGQPYWKKYQGRSGQPRASLRDRQTPLSCYRGTKVNFVQRQLTGKRVRPGGGLPPGPGHFLCPFPSSLPGLLSLRKTQGQERSEAKVWVKLSRKPPEPSC